LDTIRALDVVLANGTIVQVSKDNYPELFWVSVKVASKNDGVSQFGRLSVERRGPLALSQLFIQRRMLRLRP